MTIPADTGTREPASVVVTDVTTAQDLARTAHQVLRTVPRGVEVVLIVSRGTRVPPATARRVRVVRAQDDSAMAAAVRDEACRERTVVVLTADCSVTGDWLAEVEHRLAQHPYSAGTSGQEGAAMLLAFPPGVTYLDATRVPWGPVPGLVTRGPAARRERSVSAVMIVKDEEAVLADALTAVAPFVDEVVVYDTGSSDRTVEIAREHGAVVVEGYWDDSFGRARNRALEHATQHWVLQVDADEVVTGDPAALRTRLAEEQADQLRVVVVSTTFKGATAGEEILPVRLFRRQLGHWTGALHEYVVPRPGTGHLALSHETAPLRLVHSGYQRATIEAKDKITRNVTLSQAALEADDTGPEDGDARAALLSNHGRSLLLAGRTAEGLATLAELREGGGNSTVVLSGGRAALGVLVDGGRPEELEAWLTTAERIGESAGNIAAWRARAALAVGDAGAAEAHLDAVDGDGGRDLWGAPFDDLVLRELRIRVALARGDDLAARELAVALLADEPARIDTRLLIDAHVRSGRPVGELVPLCPEVLLERSLREVSAMPVDVALAWFSAFRDAAPDDFRPLVAGSAIAAKHGWQEALSWSARTREAGFPEICALRVLGERASSPMIDRCVAWVLLGDAFGEQDAWTSLRRLTTRMRPWEVPALADLLTSLGIAVSAEQLGLDRLTTSLYTDGATA